VSPELRQKILDAFNTDDAVAVAAKHIGVGRDRVTRTWKEVFGKDSVRERANRLRGLAKSKTGNAADPKVRAKALSAFSTEEPMKKVALRLGVHYAKIREWWGAEHGDQNVRARGSRLQKIRSAENAKKHKGQKHQVRKVEVLCETCGTDLEVSAISAAKRHHFFCAPCDQKRRGADTACPICGLMCVGSRGLTAHLHSAQDEEHQAWRSERAEEKLGDLGTDHVSCRECGHRAKNLWKHLETAHDMTPSSYVRKWPGACWRIERVEQKRLSASLEGRAKNDFWKGAQKEVNCPTCGQQLEVSLFAGSLHDLRCDDCKAEDELILWKGKKEPADYVSCRECGHRAENLTSHLRSAHDFERYCKEHPEAPFTALRAGQRFIPANKLVLTELQLRPFRDKEGRVIAAAAAKALNCAQWQIRRNCADLGLKTRSRLGWQKLVLDNAASALGTQYESEWTDPRIFNEMTGRLFHFDGYFSAKSLILEAHGEQHFYFIESWHKTHEEFERLQELDRFKIARARKLGYEVKVVRYQDPVHDVRFWKKLFGGDASLWANKNPELRAQDIDHVFQRLREEGFPKLEPSKKTKAEFTKLSSQTMHVDPEGFVRPYTYRGTTVCASFFPNRADARYRGALSLREAWQDDTKLKSAIKVQLNAGHPTTGPRVLKALMMLCRTPSVFRPGVTKFVCDRYGVPGGVMWDPCAGYGGRLFGVMASGMGLYIGTDVEPATIEGNRALAEALSCSEKCKLVHARAETFDPKVPLDLVFTSPPYFDLEVYGESSKKALSYSNINDWVGAFLAPLIKTAFSRLRSGGHLVLNLPAKPLDGLVLADEAVRLAAAIGFSIQPPVYMPVRRLRSKALRADPLLVFRR